MTQRGANWLCAVKDHFEFSGVGKPLSHSGLDGGPESRDGEKEEFGLQNREQSKVVFKICGPAVGQTLNQAPRMMPTFISLPADREKLLDGR